MSTREVSTQTELSAQDVTYLEEKSRQNKIVKDLTQDRLKSEDDQVKSYTGLPSYSRLMSF